MSLKGCKNALRQGGSFLCHTRRDIGPWFLSSHRSPLRQTYFDTKPQSLINHEFLERGELTPWYNKIIKKIPASNIVLTFYYFEEKKLLWSSAHSECKFNQMSPERVICKLPTFDDSIGFSFAKSECIFLNTSSTVDMLSQRCIKVFVSLVAQCAVYKTHIAELPLLINVYSSVYSPLKGRQDWRTLTTRCNHCIFQWLLDFLVFNRPLTDVVM